MLSSVSRLFSHQTVMEGLKQSALKLATQFSEDGLKQYYTRWGNHIYDEGLSIKDEKKFNDYTKLIKDDIAAIERQVTLHKLYADVE